MHPDRDIITKRIEKALIGAAILAVFSVFVLFFTNNIGFVTQDLGRHLMNGRLFFVQHIFIPSNYYSYTEPDFPTVMHHWGAGVIFYAVYFAVGFAGLSVFFALLQLLTFMLFIGAAKRRADWWYVLLAAVAAMPLIALRAEIRPEVFTTLFLGVFWYILARVRDGSLAARWLWLLPFVQLGWVNTHIFFPLGIASIGFFMMDAFLEHRDARPYGTVMAGALVACFINPFGWRGVLEPFLILKEYGYMVAENQSVLFMQRRFGSGEYLHFEIVCGLIAALVVWALAKRRAARLRVEIAMALLFGLGAWRMTRGLAQFGFVMIPVCAAALQVLLEDYPLTIRRLTKRASIAAVICGLTLNLVPRTGYASVWQGAKGIGLLNGVDASARFFIEQRLRGPIFNNYDIGSYLIFYLFPAEKVFVDNRPEAYSVPFMKDVYVRMQEDESVWKEYSERYRLNVIYFYRHDMTPWAQPFLIRRIDDKAWAPVFVDSVAIIFVRRTAANAAVIRQYELPRSMFVVTK